MFKSVGGHSYPLTKVLRGSKTLGVYEFRETYIGYV